MRTLSEIEKDYKKIRNIIETTDVASIREISEMTGLSSMEIKTSLSKHPRVEKTLYEKLAKNKELKRKRKKEEKLEDVESKSSNTEIKEKEQENKTLNYVIDASICGTSDCQSIISNICKTSSKIILTSITIKELDNMQFYNNIAGTDAKLILSRAARNPNSFIGVEIDETLDEADDCIIKYCHDNKDRVLLYTADKKMAINARMHGVQTEYLLKARSDDNSIFGTHKLADVKKSGGKLMINCYNAITKSILAICDGIEYKDGTCELKIGDDVYVSTKKEDFVTFAHYRITSLYLNKNAIIIYHHRIYKKDDISKLPEDSYKSFVLEFMNK